MKSTQLLLSTVVLSLLFTGALAQTSTISGTVTNKTADKPAAGDSVVLVDPQAGMKDVAHATTDARGHYTLNAPGSTSYLVRAIHQGVGYFMAAPQNGVPVNLSVYDVAAKISGVFIEADVLEVEAVGDRLRVTERYFVHNASVPPRTQWSPHTFEIILPVDAVISGVEAQRPTGLPTTLKLDPVGPKGHYSFNFPIQPDDGDKNTLFNLSYELPYSGGKYTFKPQVSMSTQNVGVLLPKSMTFTAGAGSTFQSMPENPGIQTFVVKNLLPGKSLEFTISGTGTIPREGQDASAGQQSGGGTGAQDSAGQGQANARGSQPGGGLGAPANTPDPISKYKWWILGGLALLLAAAAAFLLREPTTGAAPKAGPDAKAETTPVSVSPATEHAALLNTLKEELFALESEKIAGKLTPEEYAEQKAALETVLKRALKHSA